MLVKEMFYSNRYFLLLFLLLFFFETKADNKNKIISKFQNIKNLTFNFEQNINGKIEEGKCIVEYPKKIYCKYNTSNNKTLVSNGKSLVISTDIGSYYRYPLKTTPLNFILDKNFIINEIIDLNEKIIDDKLINFTIKKEKLKLDIFFDKDSSTIKGWQTLDIYQNINYTFLSDIVINQKIESNIFNLPKLN
jgi:outer membrane lipoprotein-sorting protein